MGRFINADAYASTGQGILGNNMFAYCLNNPAVLVDMHGTYPHKDIFRVCLNFNDKPYELTLADYIAATAKPMNSTMDELLEHTWSAGFTGGFTSGGISKGKTFCISGDYYGNFALQETTSEGASIGEGGSGGFYVSITNASNVQDLSGESLSLESNFYVIRGGSVQVVYFEPTPGDVKWGISFVFGGGAQFSLSVNQNYTTSTESWHIWDWFT